MTELLDACPSCGGRWAYVAESGKRYWDGVGGSIVNDRVASWHCLHCLASWPRGDTSIYRDVAPS